MGKITEIPYIERIKNVFAGRVATGWDTKGELISEMEGNDNIVYKWLESNLVDGMCLLDVGCATGRLIQKVVKYNKNVFLYGIDVSRDMTSRAEAKFKTPNSNVTFITDEFLEHDFGSVKFDVIVFKFTLHHIENKEQALQKAEKLLNKGGRLIIYTPGSKHFEELFQYDKNKQDILGRESEEQLKNMLKCLDMEINVIQTCKFKMRFKNFDNLLCFLKSTGNYQRIMNYENKEWTDILTEEIKSRYCEKMWHQGEFLLAVYTKI